MNKLSATRIKERTERSDKIRTLIVDLNQKIGEYEIARVGVEEALSEVNAAIADAQSWCEEIAAEIDDYVQARSEKWQESDKASQYEDWKQEFENLELEEIDLAGGPELPEIEPVNEDEIADNISSLPDAPDAPDVP